MSMERNFDGVEDCSVQRIAIEITFLLWCNQSKAKHKTIVIVLVEANEFFSTLLLFNYSKRSA